MLNDYIRDQGTAETKYKNKKVSITGKVQHKSQFDNSPIHWNSSKKILEDPFQISEGVLLHFALEVYS